MRDPVSLPLLPRSNLQPQSLRREDEADPGSNHKSVSYRYVEPQIYSGVGMYMYVLCCKRRESRSRGGGLCWALLPGEVVAEAEARGSGGGGRGRGTGGTPRPGAAGAAGCCLPPGDFHYCAGSEPGLFNVNGEHGAARLRPTSARWVISS